MLYTEGSHEVVALLPEGGAAAAHVDNSVTPRAYHSLSLSLTLSLSLLSFFIFWGFRFFRAA